MKWVKWILILGAAFLLLAGGAMLVPAIRDRVLYHAENWYTQIRYALFPPENAVFVPSGKSDPVVRPTVVLSTSTPTPKPAPSATLPPDQPSPTSTQAPTAIPAQYELSGVKYFDQHGLYNYCAPSNLAMELSYWGWSGDRTDVGKVVKPFEKDKNVMPYELADYVTGHTQLKVVQRIGGSLELVKALIAGGFPVLVEKGAYLEDLTNKISWMGHYTVVTGYDDGAKQFNTQDSFFHANYPVSYADFATGWRAFNYVFLVVYAPDKESQLMALLNSQGQYGDEKAADQIALDRASKEIYTTGGNDQFFAWYNRGSSLVALQDFNGASEAYDQAFQIYAKLSDLDKRPWRMVWYQTGPYFAYYYSGRYSDVERLATQTIDAASEPYIEESWYWRAMARVAMGSQDGAVADLRQSLQYHPGFQPSLDELNKLGVAP